MLKELENYFEQETLPVEVVQSKGAIKFSVDFIEVRPEEGSKEDRFGIIVCRSEGYKGNGEFAPTTVEIKEGPSEPENLFTGEFRSVINYSTEFVDSISIDRMEESSKIVQYLHGTLFRILEDKLKNDESIAKDRAREILDDVTRRIILCQEPTDILEDYMSEHEIRSAIIDERRGDITVINQDKEGEMRFLRALCGKVHDLNLTKILDVLVEGA